MVNELLEQQLLEQAKKLQKNIISSIIATSASSKSMDNINTTNENAEGYINTTKNSVQTTLNSLEGSLKGQFGTQARELLKSHVESLNV
ncbi:hypothetical protein [Miniphocaeibacter massiliensis]|uniref:hypothetical protein n=1 Tax=Miniphocaeibacter massiliensis TaxID=2041841 RepID=UPI000C0827C3|nr:hypothetical protein [Miniphocaeibacter massiliensis]